MPRIDHFFLSADNPERAIQFYKDVFGWRFEVQWEYDTPAGREKNWSIQTSAAQEPGIDGSLARREYPGQPIGVGVQVSSVDTVVSSVERSGGKILVPKIASAGVGWFAVCQDPEQNTFAIYEKD